MEIVDAYEATGTYRGAAALCGTSHKTVKRVLERQQAGQVGRRLGPPRPRNTDGVQALVAEKVRATAGRISAKRLLPVARTAGYAGSARNLRRAVAAAKAAWKRERRTYRPWLPVPGEHLVVDWSPEAGLRIFCAVLAWSRYRFVRFAPDETRPTTLALLAECFEELGGVPAVVLTDRMGCLKAGVVANVVVPHPDYVAFAAHYGFRPDFCEAADPESKGVVEALAGYAQRDLVVPALADGGWADLAAANAAARAWGAEVNGRPHRETAAVPAERLAAERAVLRPLPARRPPRRRGVLRKVDRLGMVGLAAARYAVPDRLGGQRVEVVADEAAVVIRDAATGAEVARHAPVAPGEVALGTVAPAAATRRPARGLRPRTASEVAFLGLGPPAAAFLRAAAAAGTTRLPGELAAIVALEPGWGRAALTAALERATRFRRFRAADVRAILAAGPHAPEPARPGAGLGPLAAGLPAVPVRPLSAYALPALPPSAPPGPGPAPAAGGAR
jgi:Mu transposase, C-terminal domain/Integrase core domain